MNYSALRSIDVSDGPGIGVSLFCSGCNRHCPGCHNPKQWDFEYGENFNSEVLGRIIELIQPGHCTRFSLLGGEPCDPKNIQHCSAILHAVKDAKPSINVWLYTGYTLEELEQRQDVADSEILSVTDYLVDGPFIQEQRDITLAFRGSSNQRIFDISNYPKVENVTEKF